MPRGENIAPDAERVNTREGILKDFREGKARIYRGIPALRVFTKDRRSFPIGDFPYYEHHMYGDKFFSIITNVQIEEFFKRNKGAMVEGPIDPDTNLPTTYVRKYEFEKVYIDAYLTPHEKAAFDVGDATNPYNVLRMLDEVMAEKDDSGALIMYRRNIHEAITGFSYDPITVDMGISHIDIWPSGPNRGRYLADLDVEFLEKVIRQGSAKTSDSHMKQLAAVASGEKTRRKKQEEKMESEKKGAK